jgi:mannose-6-phosphate isomerase-like protein (cupin superfamily)
MKVIRFLSTIFSICVLFSLQAMAQTNSDKYNIETCVNEFDFDQRVIKKVGYQYWFVDKEFVPDGRTLKMSVVKPNSQTHEPHTHKEDEFFFVIEGKAEFHLNGETKVVDKYATFYCPANSTHGIRNVGDTELKYLVIKTIK